MIIKRSLFDPIKKQLQNKPKIILLYGPRQAGKTTLINQVVNQYRGSKVFFRGEDLRTQDIFAAPNLDKLKRGVGDASLLIIDEAQYMPNIGVSLKLLYDTYKTRIIASGSSSFDLANKVNEPLTGRSVTFTLYPLSILEIAVKSPDTSIDARLEEFLLYGMYPEVITTTGEDDKKNYLYNLVNNYLYRDILNFQTVRKPKKVTDLLSLLALQIGQEVSVAELAQNLSLSKIIVEKYLDILEKMFVIINLRGFSRNLRKEISKTSKYYFVDLGLRNALIRNFNPLNLRSDKGVMFENFCFMERLKMLINKRQYANFYFWRTYDQKEIDLIEEKEGEMKAFEFKWFEKKKITSGAKEFQKTYEKSTFQIITPNTLADFLDFHPNSQSAS